MEKKRLKMPQQAPFGTPPTGPHFLIFTLSQLPFAFAAGIAKLTS
jgi:hypothetical protein